MPVNVAVEEPGADIVGEEADRDIVLVHAGAHDVADYGVDEIVRVVSAATDDVEGLSVQVDRMLWTRGAGR